jgi:hypothetical protein
MQARGVLNRLPMFIEILEDGIRWPDGTVLHADVILWCTRISQLPRSFGAADAA